LLIPTCCGICCGCRREDSTRWIHIRASHQIGRSSRVSREPVRRVYGKTNNDQTENSADGAISIKYHVLIGWFCLYLLLRKMNGHGRIHYDLPFELCEAGYYGLIEKHWAECKGNEAIKTTEFNAMRLKSFLQDFFNVWCGWNLSKRAMNGIWCVYCDVKPPDCSSRGLSTGWASIESRREPA
jgi:hypothetical protein